MTQAFEQCFKKLLGVEGDFSDHPSDLGGATRWGITEAVARSSGWHGPMRELPVEVAMQIARAAYWDPLCLDDIAIVSSVDIAYELFDTGYNMGPGWAIHFLQRALNALNSQQRFYFDIAVDDKSGPRTVSALEKYVQTRHDAGLIVLLKMLNCLQGERYIRLAESREKNEDFVYGWFQHRVTL